jgi:hypothetical protein
MHWITTLIVTSIWGVLGLLSDHRGVLKEMGLSDYVPPNMSSQAAQVIGGTLFLSIFDYLVENIIMDAQGNVTSGEHQRVLERMIDMREENEMLKRMLLNRKSKNAKSLKAQ